MAQPGAVPKKLPANYGHGMHRMSGTAAGIADTPVYVRGIGIIGSPGRSTFFAPAHTAVSVHAVSSNINISIAPAPYITAPVSAPVADPLRRVRQEHDRVSNQARGAFSEVRREGVETKYEVSVARVGQDEQKTTILPAPAKGCCDRFCNWLRCKP